MFFPQLTTPRDRYTIASQIRTARMVADLRGDTRLGDHLFALQERFDRQLRLTELANDKHAR